MIQLRIGLAALAVVSAAAAGQALAQPAPSNNPYVVARPAGAFNSAAARRNIAIAPGAIRPAASPCAVSGAMASLSTCSGPMYATIRVQRTGGGAGFGMLLFRTPSLTRGVATPAMVRTPLRGGPSTYLAQVPPQLCVAGGPAWEVILIGSNLQNLGVIGSFQPTGCP